MAKLYKHKSRGYQLWYRIYFPAGGEKRKWRHYPNKLQGMDALRNAERLEHGSLRGNLTQEELLLFRRTKLLSEQELTTLYGKSLHSFSLAELAEILLKRLELECTPDVQVTNRYRICHLLHYFGEDRLASSLSVDTIDGYRHYRINQGISAATVNKEMTKLAQMLDIAVKRKNMFENPARYMKKLKDFRDRKPRSLTKDEIERLLAAAKESRRMRGLAYEVILCYLFTGMRRNELLNLKWSDINFEQRKVYIKGKADAKRVERVRTVGLSKKLLGLFMGLDKSGLYVFGGEKPLMSGAVLTIAFKKIIAKAGLPKEINIHTLRHTYITHLMERGVNPRRVQELAGHLSFGTTWRYSHVLPSEEVVEDLLDF